MNKATSDRHNESDRAVTIIPILDGQLGGEMEIKATAEGLEFDGYSTLDWAWIDSARAQIARTAQS